MNLSSTLHESLTMFTPQRKGWVGFLSPNGNTNPASKGKAVTGGQESLPPPPRDSLAENGGGGGVDVTGVSGGVKGGISGEMESWRLFRDAGLMDESLLARKDREALAQKITELEKEVCLTTPLTFSIFFLHTNVKWIRGSKRPRYPFLVPFNCLLVRRMKL